MIVPSKERGPTLPPQGSDDHPPPYSISISDSGHAGPTTPDPPPVNHVFISTRYRDISGTFHIDPNLSSPYEKNLNLKARRRSRKTPTLPNASFRTRHGAISLNLAVTGPMDNITQATVHVTSRSGDINLNLLPGHSTKRINLNVRSRNGNILLLVPKSFHGAIQLRTTRKGNLNFLPAFANVMKLLKGDDNEALVLVGDSAPGNAGHPDYYELTSHFGKITVGVIGEDNYVAEAGIWRRFGDFLRAVGSAQLANVPS